MASIIEENAVQSPIHCPSSSTDPAVSEASKHIARIHSTLSSPEVIGQGKHTGRLNVQLGTGELATPMRFNGVPGRMATIVSESFPPDDSCPMDVDNVEDVPPISIRTEWIGTSELHIDMNLDLQFKA